MSKVKNSGLDQDGISFNAIGGKRNIVPHLWMVTKMDSIQSYQRSTLFDKEIVS